MWAWMLPALLASSASTASLHVEVPKAEAHPIATRGPICDTTRSRRGVRWTPAVRVAPAGSNGIVLRQPELVWLRGSSQEGELLAFGSVGTADLHPPGTLAPVELPELGNPPLPSAGDSARHRRRLFDSYHAPGFRMAGDGTVRRLTWPAGVRRFGAVRAVANDDTAHVIWGTGSSFARDRLPSTPVRQATPTELTRQPPADDTLWYARWQDGAWTRPVRLWTGRSLRWTTFSTAALVVANGELHFAAAISHPQVGPAVLYLHGRDSTWTAVTIRFRRLVGEYLGIAVRPDSSIVLPYVAGVPADSGGPNSNSVVVIRASRDGTVRDQRVLYLSRWREAYKLAVSSGPGDRLRVVWERAESTRPTAPDARAPNQPRPLDDEAKQLIRPIVAWPAETAADTTQEITGVVSDDGGDSWSRVPPLRISGLVEARHAAAPDGTVWSAVRAESDSGRMVLAARHTARGWSVWRVWSPTDDTAAVAMTTGLTTDRRGLPRMWWTVLRLVNPVTREPLPPVRGADGKQQLAYTLATTALSCGRPSDSTP